ncbi:MAG: CPBP family intramembrane metalloprotease [Deltaproteobacteria bacterium]|nr:CPBP family intramembrane metalloprotease [Deltaproteobacteria bacterium]
MTKPPSALRAGWLLVRLRLRRAANQAGSIFQRKKAAGGKRAATAPKRGPGFLGAAVLYGLMLWGFFGFCSAALASLHQQLGHGHAWLVAVQIQTGFLLLATIVLGIGSRELSRPEWDLEWLVTLPLSLRGLLGVRIVERTVVNASGWLALWTFLTTLAKRQGFGAASPLAGMAGTLPLLLISGVVRTVFDTGLRVVLRSGSLRNLQALLSIAGLLAFWLALFAPSGSSLLADAADAAPSWVEWLPSSLAVRALAGSGGAAWTAAGVLAAETGLVLAAGALLLRRLLRSGVVAAGSRESVRTAVGRGSSGSAAGASAAVVVRVRRWISPLQGRELRLLARDRAFLVQTLILPLLIVGMQFVLNSRAGSAAAVFGAPQHLAAVAFGAAAYMLMFSAFQTLNAEGPALWLLFSFPRPLDAMVRDKARLWGVIATSIAAAVLVIGAVTARAPLAATVVPAAIVLAGIPIYATIATSLGVFACNPLATDVRRRVRPDYLYLYMLLASFYAFAIYTPDLWPRVVLVVLSLLLALALWQKAKDRLPLLLDPGAVARSEVSLSDGLIAAMLFFVLQGVVALMALSAGAEPGASTALVIFTLAGALTWGLVRYVMWRHKTTGVPAFLGAGAGRAVFWGLAGGAAAILAGLAYVWILPRTPWFPEDAAPLLRVAPGIDPALAVLAVAGAPIFEEWIFRGLVFGGLRRSYGPWRAALASAAIFAVMHPPLAVVPVFLVGLCAAAAYQRAGILLAPVLVHALYNGALLALG